MEDVKLIGICQTKTDCEAAIQRLRFEPGFRDRPDEFTCEKYELNKDHCTEGFIIGDDDDLSVESAE